MSLIVENIIFKDSAGNSSIQNTGSQVNINAPNNIVITATNGNIQIPENLNINSLSILNCNGLKSQNNTDIILSSISSQDFILRTSTTTRMTLFNSGSITTTTMPKCSVLPTQNTEFINWNNFTNNNLQTYNPTITSSNGTITPTYSNRGGYYVQYGNLVWFSCFVICSSLSFSDSSSSIRISLPLTPPNGGFIQSLIVGNYGGLDNMQNIATISGQISGGVTRSYFILNKKETGTSTDLVSLKMSDTTNNFSVCVTGTYYLF